MKKYLVILLLLFSFISFSQTEDKEVLNLMDSIQAVNPYENLYAEINKLQAKERDDASIKLDLENQKAELNNFFFRQILYRKIFDQLELGITLDPLELEKYSHPIDNANFFWPTADWRLLKIPETGSKYPIVIFYDPETNTKLNDSQTLKGYPFSDFAIAFINGDAVLKKRYPKVYAMIQSGKIVFSIKSFETPSIVAMQAIKLEFPSNLFSNTDKSLQSRQKLADNLLSWISDVAAPVLNKDYTTENLVSSYLKVEKEKLKKGTVEDKIELRMKFIEYLRKKYH